MPLSLAFAGQSWHVPGGDLPKHRAGCGIYLAPFGGFNLFPIFFWGKWWKLMENVCFFLKKTIWLNTMEMNWKWAGWLQSIVGHHGNVSIIEAWDMKLAALQHFTHLKVLGNSDVLPRVKHHVWWGRGEVVMRSCKPLWLWSLVSYS